MPVFDNLGSNQPYLKNHLENQPGGEKFVFLAREQARYIYNNLSLKNSRYSFCWLKALDRRGIRVATRGKIPLRKGWPNCYERLTVDELLRKYGEWGARTGKRLGNKWYVIADLDLRGFSKTLWKQLEKNFLLMKGRQRIRHIRTKRGYHDIFLLDELPPNGAIYHTDKFGVKRKIGDILAVGLQAQALGSPDKEPAGKGKWAWQAKNIQEISEIWAKYFLEIKCEENNKISVEQKEINNINPREVEKSSQELNFYDKFLQNLGRNIYKTIKLERIRITSKQTTKKTNYCRVNYCDQQKRRGFFLLDSYFRDKKALIQPNLVADFILRRGYKYQFYLGIG